MSDTLSDLEIRRAELECEKLQAEIAEKRLAWWKRPAYLGGAAPVVIALAGVASAWAAGFFETQRANLAREVAVLEASVSGLDSEEARLTQVLSDSQNEIDTTYLRLKNAEGHARYTQEQIDSLYASIEGEAPRGAPLADLRFALEAEWVDEPHMEEAAAALRALELEAGIAADLEDIADLAQEDLRKLIEAVPASDWAKSLTYDPLAESRGALKAADGAYYIIETGEVLDQDAFDALDN